ncbi:PIG-L family deacetylase [Candidatus Megaera polyxenophila]|jgi:LmbE family N-acetylglucosaminyl deacetylase|uniref:PIG-L deacetylase family protein n=1 Tax=Candidatus Megaera polyxenophila TaxID=988779 RepID=UPI00249DA987|nr:PIG-L family deacetylase [Candidatus Megaera polyxenophila]
MLKKTSSPKKLLVLGPHPDDEIACAGLIRRLAENGFEIYHWFFSLCENSIKRLGGTEKDLLEECNNSRTTLGIPLKNCGHFSFPVRHFQKYRQEILEELILLKKKINPSLVLIPSRHDIHQDHSCVYQESLRAFKHCSILGYELPWNMFSSNHNFFVNLTEEQFKIKMDALKCYKSQSSKIYFDQEFFYSLAKVRGVQVSTQFAEAYEPIRVIIE